MVLNGETSGSTDAATFIYWIVGLIVALVAFLSPLWFLGTLHIDYDALDAWDHDFSTALDADRMNYTDISRLPANMSRGSISSETLAALSGSQGDLASSIVLGECLVKRSMCPLEIVKVEETCCVCREHLMPDQGVKTLRCNHQFHPKCIDEWLGILRTCPLCRIDV